MLLRGWERGHCCGGPGRKTRERIGAWGWLRGDGVCGLGIDEWRVIKSKQFGGLRIPRP